MTSDDEFFRSQLSGRPVSGDADFALISLKPAMKRARLRRHVAVGTMTVALVGMGGAGVAAMSSSRAAPTLQSSSAPAETRSTTESSEPPDVATSTDGADDGSGLLEQAAVELEDDAPEPVEVPEPSEGPGSSSPAVPTSGQPTVSSPSGTTAPAITAAAPVVSPSKPATTTTSTTVRATTSTSAPVSGEKTITSSCGLVTVGFIQDSVNLLGTQPGSGFEVDLKNVGPEQVEVGFAGGDDECEVKAWMHAGQLTYSVDNHES